jgi:ABC-type multidrug transport system ATPase subunit
MVWKSLVYSRFVVLRRVYSERVCNRLGIMVDGQFACLGAIQHLKSKFGEGYMVDIKVRAAPDDTQGTTIQSVQTFLLSQAQFQVQVREITHSTGSFQIRQDTPADLFELLEQNKQQLSIETYTISQTTSEQIFLSFGKHVADV